MARVTCSIPTASELINGVKFVSAKVGMVSEEIADDVAAAFCKIPGFDLVVRGKAKAEQDGGADSASTGET